MTSNEQKLRSAAVLMVGVDDTIEALAALHNTLIAMGAAQDVEGAVSLNLINTLIETHPEYVA